LGLIFSGFIALPENNGPGGFDHASVHLKSRRLYVAHTANDSLDVIDLRMGKFPHSILGAGADLLTAC
jgi:hypothetical protein